LVILGIDSSDIFLSVGLADDGGIIHSRSSESQVQNKNILHSFLIAMLADTGISIKEVEGVSVAIGPGSFTGLRVGLAVAKGICWSLNLPLAGVSSLAALAKCCTAESGEVLAVKDAKRDEFYYAGFARSRGGVTQIVADSIGPPGQVASLIGDGFTPFGPGLRALSKYLPEEKIITDNEAYDRDRLGGAVALIGLTDIGTGKVLDLASAVPNYIRMPKPREWKP
jgi:tRNA threonylcarbamoyladenosine biosynthesis protein TsaB